MTATEQAQLQAALTEAVISSIQKMGLPAFKATSLFGSNERAALRKAA